MAFSTVVSTSDSQMVDYPLVLQAVAPDTAIPYNASDFRGFYGSLFPVEGVLGINALKVTQRGAGANFSVDISSGAGAIQGDDTANQGKYVVTSNGTVNVTTPTAPASGTRTHRIIAAIRDKQALGTGTYDWVYQCLDDTGTGTPATPNSAISLATVAITNGQSSVQNTNITDTRPLAQIYNSPGLIAQTILTSTAATVSFQNIPQNYRHLMLTVQARSDAAGTTPVDSTIRLNNDSGSVYSGAHLDLPMGGSLSVATANGQAQSGTFPIPAGGISSNVAGGGFAFFLNYTDTNWRPKNWYTLGAAIDFGTIGDMKVRWATWCPASPTAVNRIDITCATGNFVANSYFAIRGFGS